MAFNDPISLKRLELLDPNIREEAIRIIKEEIWAINIPMRVTHTFRSFDEQNELYAIGRTKTGTKVTNAKGGLSYHNYGLALDFCLLLITPKIATWNQKVDLNKNGKADWQEIVEIFKKHGWKWGGNFKSINDADHLQKDFGYDVHTLLAMQQKQGTTYLKLA